MLKELKIGSQPHLLWSVESGAIHHDRYCIQQYLARNPGCGVCSVDRSSIPHQLLNKRTATASRSFSMLINHKRGNNNQSRSHQSINQSSWLPPLAPPANSIAWNCLISDKSIITLSIVLLNGSQCSARSKNNSACRMRRLSRMRRELLSCLLRLRRWKEYDHHPSSSLEDDVHPNIRESMIVSILLSVHHLCPASPQMHHQYFAYRYDVLSSHNHPNVERQMTEM